MWHKGDYRIIFRYEYPSNEAARKAMEKMVDVGAIARVSNSYVKISTVAILQRRVSQDGLSAWATLGCGYAFCSWQDKFNKSQGRTMAFTRAINQTQSPHREVFGELWNEHNEGATDE